MKSLRPYTTSIIDPETNIAVRVPVYQRIQHELRRGIQSGVYNPGEKIPSETELAERFETTRATVVRALQQLVFDGTIVRRAGAGSFVAPRASARPLESRRLKSFEEQAAENGERVQYQLVNFASATATDAVAAQLNLAPHAKVYRLERLRSIEGVPLSLEVRFIPPELAERMPPDDLNSLAIHDILQGSLGISIARIEVSVRVGAATRHIADHLKLSKGRPLLIRDNVLIGPQDRPLLCGTSYYTEQFQLSYVVNASDG